LASFSPALPDIIKTKDLENSTANNKSESGLLLIAFQLDVEKIYGL